MVLRVQEIPMVWEFPVAREFPEPWEIPIIQEFPRPKLFPPMSQETGISREFPIRSFPLNIPAWYLCLNPLHHHHILGNKGSLPPYGSWDS